MSTQEAIKALRDEESEMANVRRKMWARLQVTEPRTIPNGWSPQEWRGNVIDPITRAVARGLISYDEGLRYVRCLLAPTTNLIMSHWGFPIDEDCCSEHGG